MQQKNIYRKFLWLAFTCLILISNGVSAITTQWLSNPQQPNAKVRFLITGEISLDKQTVTAALEIDLGDDWKTYWRSPGEGGIAPTIKWADSDNLEQVMWHWPTPQRFELLGINTLGYKNSIVLPLTLVVKDLNNPVSLRGKLRLPACTTICVLTDYAINLDFTPAQLQPDTEAAYLVDRALSRVPALMPDNGLETVDVYWNKSSNEVVVNAISENSWNQPDIILDGVEDITFGLPEVFIQGNQLQARIKANSWLGEFDLVDQKITVTLLNGGNTGEANEAVLRVLAGSPEKLVEQGTTTFLVMIVFALSGGLILNLMPCVLPVLGLKLSSLVNASGQSAAVTRKQFLSSAAGIVVSFWLLAGFIWLLKMTGNSIGWGIQFQSPWFIIFLVIVTALFGANLLGVFEIRLSSFLSTKMASTGGEGNTGHFLQGMFVTLLATPCSAPFLGTAVAFALSSDSLSLFSIFTALGLGMSVPYLMVVIHPSLLRWLPKPGPWMIVLRRVLAILLLMTTLWLISLLNAHLATAWVLMIAMVPAMLVVFWLVMILMPGASKAIRVLVTIFLALALVIFGAWLTGMFSQARTASALNWQTLEASRISSLVAAGQMVFVDVTADWCVTCKANKAGVIDRDPVKSRLQDSDIVLMQGDWTRPSEEISAFLQKNGRFGVPFNIVYGPNTPEGIALPVILDSVTVINAIEQVSSASIQPVE